MLLLAPDESSDGEDVSMPEESDSDTDQDETSSGPQTMSEQTGSGSPPSPAPLISVSYPVTNGASSGAQTHMRAVAATRGLQISVGGQGAHRVSGLPTSPRPNRYPGSPGRGGQ
jgi:RalA-binding protein 1